MPTYPGIPAPRITWHLTREASEAHYGRGTTFAISAIEMVANTGTYIDAPHHRFASGKDLAALPLESLADLPGLVIDVTRIAARSLEPSLFGAIDVRGAAVLLATGWSKRWGSNSYWQDYPFLTQKCAVWLVENGARLVGTDAPNVDDDTDGARPVHTTLLKAEIPIVEHLADLAALPASGFRFFAVPPMIQDFTSFPVRAFALRP